MMAYGFLVSDIAHEKIVSSKYFFLQIHENICCGYSCEASQQGLVEKSTLAGAIIRLLIMLLTVGLQ